MTLNPASDQASAGAATTVPGPVPETTPPHPSGLTLPEICHTLRHKVSAFLHEKTDDEVLRGVQRQAGISMDVIRAALQRYGWVLPPALSQCYTMEEATMLHGIRGKRENKHDTEWHGLNCGIPSIQSRGDIPII